MVKESVMQLSGRRALQAEQKKDSSKCKDLEICSVIATKRALVTDVCVNKHVYTTMRNAGFSFRQARRVVPKGILKYKQTYTALSRLGARSVQENKFGNQCEML